MAERADDYRGTEGSVQANTPWEAATVDRMMEIRSGVYELKVDIHLEVF
jgi:hypothetical protein